jgi:cytochrome-b5 reductase
MVGFILTNLVFPLLIQADAQSAAGLDPKEFKKFKLREVVPINYNSSVFRFDLEHKDQELGLTVASAIVVRAKIDGEEKPVIRPYTPLANDIKGAFDLLVKVYPNGKMSSHIANLKPGDELEIKGPISKIPYTANMKKSIGMIAGGTGLTPMVQVINEILKNPEDKTEVNFVFANIAERDILLKVQPVARQSIYHPFTAY